MAQTELAAVHLLLKVGTQALLLRSRLLALLCGAETPRPLLVHLCAGRYPVCMTQEPVNGQ